MRDPFCFSQKLGKNNSHLNVINNEGTTPLSHSLETSSNSAKQGPNRAMIVEFATKVSQPVKSQQLQASSDLHRPNYIRVELESPSIVRLSKKGGRTLNNEKLLIDVEKEDSTAAVEKGEHLPEKYKRRNTHFVNRWGKTMELKTSEKIGEGDNKRNLSKLVSVVKAESS